MPILNRVAEMQEDVAGWRRHLHEHPELLYDVFETSKFVAEKLTSFGCDVVETGIGKTGVVGIIKGRHGDGPTIGFRSDMDALPILETSGKPWASKVPGKAHSCGHDGHTAMLLGRRNIWPRPAISRVPSRSFSSRPKRAGQGRLPC